MYHRRSPYIVTAQDYRHHNHRDAPTRIVATTGTDMLTATGALAFVYDVAGLHLPGLSRQRAPMVRDLNRTGEYVLVTPRTVYRVIATYAPEPICDVCDRQYAGSECEGCKRDADVRESQAAIRKGAEAYAAYRATRQAREDV